MTRRTRDGPEVELEFCPKIDPGWNRSFAPKLTRTRDGTGVHRGGTGAELGWNRSFTPKLTRTRGGTGVEPGRSRGGVGNSVQTCPNMYGVEKQQQYLFSIQYIMILLT